MTDYLNAIYPSASAPVDEAMQKQAQLELFSKLAAENDIDLASLEPAQITELYDQTVKVAMEEEEEEKKNGKGKGNLPPAFLKHKKDKGDDEDEKEKEAAALEQAALAEHADKVAGAQKLAEGHQIGEVMAHSFVAKVAELEAANEAAKQAATDPAKDPAVPAEATSEAAAAEVPKVASAPGGASAFDIVAAKGAIHMAKEAGYSAEEVAQRVNAVLVLGAPESTKIAHIQDPGTAVQTRSLELLEAAGLAVNWEAAQS